MSERIDAHHHLWKYQKKDYGWISDGMKALARDFVPADLEQEMSRCGVGGAIAVQARQTIEETNWLLAQAKKSQLIRGVVGWAPMASPGLPGVLEKWSGQGLLKGLRHIVQDEPDDEFILREDFNAGIAAIAGFGLVYDILIYERQLPAAIRFVDRHPNQIFVLDHLAKPRIKEHDLEPWRGHLCELARRGNVYCKLSGMVTEADWAAWTARDLVPYVDAALDAFGPDRLMFGSDWPVCILAGGYRKWFEAVQELLAKLSGTERESILGGVARKVYSC